MFFIKPRKCFDELSSLVIEQICILFCAASIAHFMACYTLLQEVYDMIVIVLERTLIRAMCHLREVHVILLNTGKLYICVMLCYGMYKLYIPQFGKFSPVKYFVC